MLSGSPSPAFRSRQGLARIGRTARARSLARPSASDLLSPELCRLLEAVAENDLDGAEDVLPAALARVDSAATRAELARAARALRDAGRVGARLAALALVDLNGEITGR